MDKSKVIRYAVFALAAALLIGIFFYYTSPRTVTRLAPEIMELGGGSKVISVNANQRLLIAGHSPWLSGLFKAEAMQSAPSPGKLPAASTRDLPYLTICAEPSPDALTDLNSESALSFREKLGEAKNKFGTLGQNIGARTPTVQVLRDAMYRLCEAFNAGGLSPPAYALLLRQYQDIMVGMLAIEDLSTSLNDTRRGSESIQASEPAASGPRSDGAKNAKSSSGQRTSTQVPDTQSFAPAIARIVETVVNHDRRTDYCLTLLSYPPAIREDRTPDGKPISLYDASDDENRVRCRAFLFGDTK